MRPSAVPTHCENRNHPVRARSSVQPGRAVPPCPPHPIPLCLTLHWPAPLCPAHNTHGPRPALLCPALPCPTSPHPAVPWPVRPRPPAQPAPSPPVWPPCQVHPTTLGPRTCAGLVNVPMFLLNIFHCCRMLREFGWEPGNIGGAEPRVPWVEVCTRFHTENFHHRNFGVRCRECSIGGHRKRAGCACR